MTDGHSEWECRWQRAPSFCPPPVGNQPVGNQLPPPEKGVYPYFTFSIRDPKRPPRTCADAEMGRLPAAMRVVSNAHTYRKPAEQSLVYERRVQKASKARFLPCKVKAAYQSI
jgi:hypothetical protein